MFFRKRAVFAFNICKLFRPYFWLIPLFCIPRFIASPKHVVVVDEMYIKEGLVLQKSSGALIGYQDLGDINNILYDAENQIKNPNNCKRPLAKLMLVFMVRGLFSSLKFPYVQFPASRI